MSAIAMTPVESQPIPDSSASGISSAPDSLRRSQAAAAFIEAVSTIPSSAYFTAEELETVYALAYAHVEQSDFEGALPLFAFLTQYAPSNIGYLKGLGTCMQQLGSYEYAIGVYSLIALLDPGALDATLRIAECHLAMKRPDAAVPLLDLLVSYGQTPQEAHREASTKVGGDPLAEEPLSAPKNGDNASVETDKNNLGLENQARLVALKADALLSLLDNARQRRLG